MQEIIKFLFLYQELSLINSHFFKWCSGYQRSLWIRCRNSTKQRQTILALAAGDIITLNNHTSAAAVTLQTLAGGTQTNINASIVIEKLN